MVGKVEEYYDRLLDLPIASVNNAYAIGKDSEPGATADDDNGSPRS